MADRNLDVYFRSGRFTTREGMMLDIPPSGFDWRAIGGVPAVVDPYAESLTQQFPLGTKLVYGSRVYRYGRMGATAGVAGNLYQAVVPLAGHIDEVIGTHAVGATAIDFTPAVAATDDLALNELQDGFFHPNDEAGEGLEYLIKSHPAITGAVLGVLTLIDPLVIAIVAAGTGTVTHNKFRSVIIHGSPPTAPVAGVAKRAVTAAYYCWLQVGGPCSVLTQGTLVVADFCVPSATVDGAVMPSAAVETDGPPVGHVMAVNVDTEYSQIWLTIES